MLICAVVKSNTPSRRPKGGKNEGRWMEEDNSEEGDVVQGNRSNVKEEDEEDFIPYESY